MAVPDEQYFTLVYSSLQKFSGLSEADFKLLSPYFEIRSFGKKEVIAPAGVVDDYLNMVVQGLVRKYIPVRNREVTIQLATEGHLIQSEISFHQRIPSEVVIETIEPTILVSMHYRNVQEALQKLPFGEALGRIIISYMFIKKDDRSYRQLKYNTRERFLDFIKTNPHMLQRVPQKILASYLNIEPETFSRLKHLVARK